MSAAEGPLVVVAGPTASGKSALAVQVALALGAEILGADSQQVYRRFDIGTAKPSAAELALVPHHLVSVVEPDEPFSAARYQALADQAIRDIRARGKRVVVVGGTGLYLRVLLRGVLPVPGADPALRQELEAFADAQGNAALHARLGAVDPEGAAALKVADRVRVVRALEIHAATGRPASALRAEHAFAEARHPHVLFVLSPPRAALYAAIDARTRAMFEGGLLDEVRELLRLGFEAAAPMGSVGYAEALAVVRGQATLEQAVSRAAQRTRHYAKRQLTWFKKEPGARFLEPPYDPGQLAAG